MIKYFKFNHVFFLTLLLVFSLTACKKSLYDNIENFPNNNWKKEKIATFKADIQDITKPVTIKLMLRHGVHIQYPTVNIAVTSVSPSGKKSTDFYGFEIRDKESGNLKGDAMGDMCDTELVLQKSIQLTEKGAYTFTVQHEMEDIILPAMMDLGLKIEVVE